MTRPHYAPPDFPIGNDHYVFVKFHAARHAIEIDAVSQSATARSEIVFESFAPGFPIFDLLADRVEARLDGRTVSIREQPSPDRITCYRTFDEPVPAGCHRLEIVHSSLPGLQFDGDGVDLRLGFFDRGRGTDDPPFNSRFFLERYLPANLEYDRHPMTLQLAVRGDVAPHRLLTNTTNVRSAPGEWTADYPSWFCSSSPLIYLLPESRLYEIKHRYQRGDGSCVDVVLAGKKGDAATVDRQAEEIDGILCKLEKRFGPFPFDRYLVVAVANGGMEYTGACLATADSLFHETVHNWFGRCLSPVDGDAGWVDEAIASWCEFPWPPRRVPPTGRNIGRRSPYARATHGEAGDVGTAVLAFFDDLLAHKGGMDGFLRHWFALRRGGQFCARDFEEDLGRFADDRDLGSLFESMVYTNER